MKFYWKGLETKTHVAMDTSRNKASVSKYHSALKTISVSEMAKSKSETKKIQDELGSILCHKWSKRDRDLAKGNSNLKTSNLLKYEKFQTWKLLMTVM